MTEEKTETNYEKIIKLRAELFKIMEQINLLEPEAVKELYKLGYSMDRVGVILKMPKQYVWDILHKSGIKIRHKHKKKK